MLTAVVLAAALAGTAPRAAAGAPVPAASVAPVVRVLAVRGFPADGGLGRLAVGIRLRYGGAVSGDGGDFGGPPLPGTAQIPGLSPTAGPGTRLARSPAPIVVTHRDGARVLAWALASTAAAAVAALALAALVVFSPRPRRHAAARELAAMPPGDDLIG
ncbi:MAG TPA: hypothetical protein VH478_25245 [Trebonia sp.]|nr:hypothetical protein [Trebonia sp.]